MGKHTVFKRVAAGILSLSVLIGVVPAISASRESVSVSDYEIELLTKLNIVTEDMVSKAAKDISRGDFSEMLTAMLGVGGGGNAIEELYNLGIVHGYGYGNSNLKESQTITTYEAVKMLVNALGYEMLAELEGGYPLGYVKIAYDVDLLSGSVENKELSYKDAMRLMIDAGNTRMATISNKSELGSVEMGGKTMFYTYFDVVKYDGILTANGYTSLDGKECIPGEVIVDGRGYETGATPAADLLGYYIELYAYENDLIDEIIVAAPKDGYNNEVTVLADTYVKTSGTLSEFTVEYESSPNKLSRIKVGDFYTVLKNGKIYNGFHHSQLDQSTADVTFIDNDRDNIYEIVKVDAYETYVVKSVNKSNNTVYGKYGKAIELDPDKADVFIYGTTGTLADFNYISPGIVLSVLKSEDGKLIKAYAVNNSVSGTIAGMSTEGNHGIINVNGSSLLITKEYADLAHADKVEPIVGLGIKAMLDMKGNVVDIELVDGVWTYGYIMKTGYSDETESVTSVTLFNQSSRETELAVGERLVVDGTSYKSSDLVSAGICRLDGGYPKAVRQLVRYKAEGTKITEIDTANYNTLREGEDSLQKAEVTDGEVKFHKDSGYFYQGSQVIFGVEDDTLQFTVPASAAINDMAYYEVKKAATNSNGGNLSGLQVFNLNDALRGKVVLREYTDAKGTGATSDYIIAKQVSTVINKDGEAVNHLEGIRLSNGAEYSNTATDRNTDTSRSANMVLNSVEFGDVIRYRDFNISGFGKVLWSASEAFGADEDFATATFAADVSDTAADAGTYISAAREYKGWITYADSADMILSNADGTINMPFRITGKPIYLVDCAEKTITPLDASMTEPYAASREKTVVVTRNGSVFGVVIYINTSN